MSETGANEGLTGWERLLLYPDKLGSVVASAVGFRDDFFLYVYGDLRRARQNPEVGVAAASDEGVLVVVVEEHDAVVGIEWPPK